MKLIKEEPFIHIILLNFTFQRTYFPLIKQLEAIIMIKIIQNTWKILHRLAAQFKCIILQI